MRKLLFILIGECLVLSLATPLSAEGVKYLLYEDFNGVTPPAWPVGWSVENPNGLAQWETRPFGGGGGGGCARYLSEPITPADDWFFSPAVALSDGIQYNLSFKYRVTSSALPHHLAVSMGDGPSSANMSVLILDLPSIDEEEIQEATAPVTVGSAGNYYIGFHCLSAPNQLAVFVDDVVVSAEETNLRLYLQMDKAFYQAGAINYATQEEKRCLIYAKNVGSATLTVNSRMVVGDPGDPDIVLSFLVTGPGGLTVPFKGKYKPAEPDAADFVPIGPGESVHKYYDLNGAFYDFSNLGDYTIKAVYRNHFKLEGQDVWLGRLVSDPVTIRIE